MHYIHALLVLAPDCIFSKAHHPWCSCIFCYQNWSRAATDFFSLHCVMLSGQFNKKLQPPQPSLAASLALPPLTPSLSLSPFMLMRLIMMLYRNLGPHRKSHDENLVCFFGGHSKFNGDLLQLITNNVFCRKEAYWTAEFDKGNDLLKIWRCSTIARRSFHYIAIVS